jgi:hypothetical protein
MWRAMVLVLLVRIALLVIVSGCTFSLFVCVEEGTIFRGKHPSRTPDGERRVGTAVH